MIFDVENWPWKSNFGTFWHLPINPILKIQQFKNLTTRITIKLQLHQKPCTLFSMYLQCHLSL